jgi:hypothetical protein
MVLARQHYKLDQPQTCQLNAAVWSLTYAVAFERVAKLQRLLDDVRKIGLQTNTMAPRESKIRNHRKMLRILTIVRMIGRGVRGRHALLGSPCNDIAIFSRSAISFEGDSVRIPTHERCGYGDTAAFSKGEMEYKQRRTPCGQSCSRTQSEPQSITSACS